MRAPLLVAATAAVTFGFASVADAQTAAQGEPGQGAEAAPVVVLPAGNPVTVVTILPPLPSVPQPSAAAAAPVVVASPAARPTAWVHIQAGSSFILEAVNPGETDWRAVCRGPCDAQVPLDALYRVTGRGMQTSKGFHLDASDGERVNIDVDPTSEGTHAGGEALVVLGGIGILTGAGLLYADAIIAASCSGPYNNCSAPTAVLVAGIGAAAAGAAGLIAGIRLMQPTGVEQSTGHDAASRPSARNERWARSPIWRDTSSDAATLPKVTNVPIFATVF